MTRSLIVGALTVVAMVCSFPGSSRADDGSITETIDGANYSVSILTGTFDDNMAALESTPWWGNPTLAQDMAAAVMDDLGTPNSDIGSSDVGQGPLFAYDDDAVDAFIWFQGTTSSVSPSESVSLDWGIGTCISSTATCAAVETATCPVGKADTGACAGRGVGNTPEPGSLGMLFAGLFAFGLLAGTKHLRRTGLATEA